MFLILVYSITILIISYLISKIFYFVNYCGLKKINPKYILLLYIFQDIYLLIFVILAKKEITENRKLYLKKIKYVSKENREQILDLMFSFKNIYLMLNNEKQELIKDMYNEFVEEEEKKKELKKKKEKIAEIFNKILVGEVKKFNQALLRERRVWVLIMRNYVFY